MPIKIKSLLSERVIEHLRKSGLNYNKDLLTQYIQIGSYKNNAVELQIPLQSLKQYNFIKNIENFNNDDMFYDVNIHHNVKFPYIGFKTNTQNLIKSIIDPTSQIYHPKPKLNINTLVEFSSPNIAKPFHVGHLRSTIIGSFISNLKEYLGHDVIRLNYLGDWGTQFGYLKLGMDIANVSDDEMKKNPIKYLYEAYVNANKLGETDPTVAEKARNIFSQLEKGCLEDMEKWKLYREYTVQELINVYKRLNVQFTKYDWESMYDSKNIADIIKLLEDKNILENLDGKKVVDVGNRKVTVVKSDGSSLYLSRDIAAALDRRKSYNFDNMYYIVDNAQTDHFIALFEILKQIDSSLYDKCRHVKFGRIQGMSTRKGEAVFLKDILDEARSIMHQRQMESPTTKIHTTEDQDTADISGTTAVIVNDLKQRRTRDYKFDWTNVLRMQGDSGIKLQHTHCRLSNLELNSGAVIPEMGVAELLQEPEALHLLIEIARFEDAVLRADAELEACVIVNYLFGLCNSVNKAMKSLQVKDQGELGNQRLLMFHCAKRVLNQGMRILGLKPLDKM